ncbi:MAG: DUF3450 family protein [Gammaproteobacteria bacterium]
MNRFKSCAACAVMLCMSPALAQDSDLTERLITLRGQVDELQSELDIRREEHKNRMAYLTAQLADLEASRDRENLRVTQLEEDLEEMRTEIAEAGVSSESLEPFVRNQISALREQVRTGFPFKVQERLAELEELETQLDNGVVTAQRAVNRLWAFIEDEFRISRENAIYSQSIALAGENVLVDVAKIGSVMMYFRTRDLEYGRAVATPQGWRFELFDSAREQELVARLFDSLRKQIRQGYFELPEALPPKGEAPSRPGSCRSAPTWSCCWRPRSSRAPRSPRTRRLRPPNRRRRRCRRSTRRRPSISCRPPTRRNTRSWKRSCAPCASAWPNSTPSPPGPNGRRRRRSTARKGSGSTSSPAPSACRP